MNTSDNMTGQNAGPQDPEPDFQQLKEGVTDALGGARQQADAQFGEYRDTAADQIEALAKGAKSALSELEGNDTLGMSDYLADMADSMTGLAGKLRNKSAEQLLHDGADLARNNPALFIAGSIALGFGLSRFLKAGSAQSSTLQDDESDSRSTAPSGGFGARRPYESSLPSQGTPPGFVPDSPPAFADVSEHPSDFATPSNPGSTPYKGEL